MRHTSRAAAATAVVTLGLSASCLLLAPTGATADNPPAGGSKAAIEHAERVSAGATLTKAQIERRERAAAGVRASRAPAGDPVPSDNSAAAWQLGVSAAVGAALGAALTGAVVVAARQANQHRRAVAA